MDEPQDLMELPCEIHPESAVVSNTIDVEGCHALGSLC